MRAVLKLVGVGALSGALTHVAGAEEMEVSVGIPRLNVAEYHKPYVAVWIARPDHSVVTNLGVWYQLEAGPEGEGETWLKDLRQWWRRTGRNLEMPVDGVSGPTRAPGQHIMTFDSDDSRLVGLTQGDFVLHVEASREVGGRELVRIPFTWGDNQQSSTTINGETELGAVSLTIKP